MSDQRPFKPPQDVVIQLEIVSEDEQHPDIADIEGVSQEIVDYLRGNGYTVEPIYTGTKGNPTFDIVVHVYQFIHDNKEWIASVLSTASIALRYLINERDKRAEKEKAQRSPLEITLYVNGHAVSSDVSSSTKSVEQSQSIHFGEGKSVVDLQDNAKIQIRVPKKKRHHKH